MPLHRPRFGVSLAAAVLALAIAAHPAHALRVATWNIARYDGSQTALEPAMRTVINGMNPDVIILQELNSVTGRNRFLANVLNTAQPGQWSASNWVQLQVSPAEGGAIFYKTAKVAISSITTLSTSGPRDVLMCWVQPAGYVSTSAWFRLYSVHLKAGGPGTADSTTRRLECTDLRNHLNTQPAGTNILVGGDTNFYGDQEGGYIRLTESQLDDDGRMKDPHPLSGSWHSISGYAQWDTQSPCLSGDCGTGFTGGGLDDRFDLWLTSYGMQDGQGVDYVPQISITSGAYPWAYGNDGNHFNQAINNGTNSTVGATIAQALHDASDHLPTLIVLQLPARVVAESELNFDPVIVGGVATPQVLHVSNNAALPGDALDYTLTAPPGFTAPGGSFVRAPGGITNNHAIGVNTATPGLKTGTLTVNCDDPDSLAKPVLLSAPVLRHGSPSLDSSAVQVAATLDFGSHAIGDFADMELRAHNQAWDDLQAGLSLDAANITGTDAGRFSIVGGFTPVLIDGVGQTLNVHFDDTGATLDQVYTATLTISSSDEPWNGATSEPDLVVTLQAKPTSGTAAAPGHRIPKVLAFYPPRPNPVSADVQIGFDLPHAATASLGIFDLAGRRVATLVSGSLEADHYSVRWDGRDLSGSRVAAGLYFARFVTPGMSRVARLVMLP
jgi:endonuclease/exonuclease/phosphatase family metal-dependent hydrolase